MTPDSIIQKAYKMASGDEENVATSDPMYDKYLSTLNDLQRDWANEVLTLPNERWASLEEEAIETVDAEGMLYLDYEIARAPLNFPALYIETEDRKIYPELVSIGEIDTDSNAYAVSGDGKTVYFSTGIIKRYAGSDVHFAVYTPVVETVKGETEGIIVQDPNWLIYMLAAEIARSDIVQAGQYGNLVALAMNSMESMKNRQRGLRVANMRPWGNI